MLGPRHQNLLTDWWVVLVFDPCVQALTANHLWQHSLYHGLPSWNSNLSGHNLNKKEENTVVFRAQKVLFSHPGQVDSTSGQATFPSLTCTMGIEGIRQGVCPGCLPLKEQTKTLLRLYGGEGIHGLLVPKGRVELNFFNSGFYCSLSRVQTIAVFQCSVPSDVMINWEKL